jgi:hypothetical protein
LHRIGWQESPEYALALDARDARLLWSAFTRSEHHGAVSLRAAFSLYAGVRLDAQGLTQHAASPTALVTLIEHLHGAGLLTRREATRVEAAILARTTKAGQWIVPAVPTVPYGTTYKEGIYGA